MAAVSGSAAGRLARARTADEIHKWISAAIVERRLPPGAKLAEERMADLLCVSRARIRQVLARLAREQVVELVPKLGAYVARPSIERAREAFEARRLIEPAVLRRLIDTITPEKVNRLRRHNKLEADALGRCDLRAAIRLSGEFHTLAAELAGNSALARIVRELTMVTGLTIFRHGAPAACSCRKDEHECIVEGVARRDHACVERLIAHHLDRIEQSLNLDYDGAEADLEAIFGP